MIIIAIVTTKGGAAKSTTSTCIAVAACEASLRVLLIDVDPQRTTAAWAARRRQPDPTVVAVKLRDLGVTLQRARDDGYRTIGDLPNTDRIMNDAFWIGLYPGMTEEMLAYMADVLVRQVRG